MDSLATRVFSGYGVKRVVCLVFTHMMRNLLQGLNYLSSLFVVGELSRINITVILYILRSDIGWCRHLFRQADGLLIWGIYYKFTFCDCGTEIVVLPRPLHLYL